MSHIASRHETVQPEAFMLRDGRLVVIRRIHPDDWRELQQMHQRLSPRTRRLRFFTHLRELKTDFAQHLSSVDFEERGAWVVTFPEERALRGVGRYECTEAGSAEVAFVVEDDLQGLGLGSELLQHLADHARERGIQEFSAVVLVENVDMIEVFRASGYNMRITYEGNTETVYLDIRRLGDLFRPA